MNGPIRLRTVLGPFLVGVLVTLGLLCLTYASAAADTGASVPDVSSSAARWYADGRLAGPVVLAVYALWFTTPVDSTYASLTVRNAVPGSTRSLS